MLSLEIANDETYPPEEAAGIARAGHYDYTVKVGRNVIARGRVENQERKHFSLLLKAIAEDARLRHFENVMRGCC